MSTFLSFLQTLFTHVVNEEALLLTTENQLKPEEGYRQFPYKDTVGKITIGYGFNLTDIGLYPEESEFMLKFRTHKALTDVLSHLPWSQSLTEGRRVVLTDMAYNLGIGGLMAFKTFLGALESMDYDKAADAMLNSLWAKQVGNRAIKLSDMIRKG